MGVVDSQPPPKDDDIAELFCQLDRNISLSSDLSVYENSEDDIYNFPSHIPVYISNWPRINCLTSKQRLPPVRKTIRRDNKVLQAVTLPTCYNMRSLMPKVDNFGTDMLDRKCDISFIAEICEKSEKNATNSKLKNFLR